ncbi:PREDICTED: RUS1 family protein C16orf58 homolog [Polistes dominula]|uniref:RUS1 family protein C16orf58 homolog n=1 Tax=Polistes dominula TaxID=743375 RepID=A0ABM1IR74_POLDO|nr:PREDICTED: RUS1 family protein C16orf58 homolog [Polistes dominula]
MENQILFTEISGNEKENIYVSSKDHTSIVNLNTGSKSKKPILSGTLSFIKDVFLPQGFPDSVHPDYIHYQIWDTVQAFASTIMGTLTTHSIMQAVGVGESTATPLAAAITWILKDGTGMVGRIVFAWWNGSDLDRQCKKWRFFADILNDVAMGMELLIPYFLAHSMVILCASTAMKSIVGVAGAATRAALTQHQALQNNLADVSAKDGSQETCVNLVASFVGIFILSFIYDGRYLLELYVFLVIVHLYANYSAIKVLWLNSLNEDRLALLIKNYLIHGTVSNAAEINKKESVFLWKKPTKDICGFNIKLGVSLSYILKRNNHNMTKRIEDFLQDFQHKEYLIFLDIKKKIIHVVLKKNIGQNEILKAYFHACLCGILTSISHKIPIELLFTTETYKPSFPLIRIYLLYKKCDSLEDHNSFSSMESTFYHTDSIIDKEYQTFAKHLENKEWNLKNNLLSINSWRCVWNIKRSQE